MAASRATRKLIALAKLIVTIVVAGVLAAGVLLPYVGGIGVATSKGADKFLDTTCDLKETALAQSTNVYASDGKTLIATLYTDNRKEISIKSIPTFVQKALIDTEDRRFYDHHGIDTRGLLRAVLNSSDGSTQGGSTLTQQYVKQVRLYQATTDAAREAAITQTSDRKIYEAKCALELEKKYSKTQILEKYFNIAFFGEQSYGIAVAARNYFNKTPAQLTVPEAAVLVGLVKDPTLYDPFINPKPARERRDEVLQNMVKAGDITAAQGATYEKSPIRTATSTAPEPAQGCSYANDKAIKNVGFFCDYAINWLTTQGGISLAKLSTAGYKIVTTINPTLQNQGQTAMAANFPSATSTDSAIMPEIDPKNGQVLAMVTSQLYNYRNAHTGNRLYTSIPVFTKPTAGSGSTFKYFTTVAALTAGVLPTQQLTTAGAPPTVYKPRYCPQDQTNPNNWIRNAGNYRPTLSLRDALVQSSNTYFVGVEDQIFGCNLSTIVKTAQDLGLTSLNAQDTGSNTKQTIAQATVTGNRYTFTLGQTSVSPLELASAYGVAANDGVLAPPTPIMSVTDVNGKAVPFKQPAKKRVMSSWVASTVTQMLLGDTERGGGGTANGEFFDYYGALDPGTHLVAGKTGTNNASIQTGPNRGDDAGSNAALWFVGVTPDVVASTAVYSIDCPTCEIDIPNQSAVNTFGAFSAGIWVAALQPYLSTKSWQWPDPTQAGIQVQSVIGESESDAIQNLTAQGFKPIRYPADCGGPSIPGNVNFFGPAYATPGATVYYCLSNGLQLVRPTPTATPTKKPPAGSTTGTSGAAGSTGATNTSGSAGSSGSTGAAGSSGAATSTRPAGRTRTGGRPVH